MQQHFISRYYVDWLYDYVREQGVSPESVFDSGGRRRGSSCISANEWAHKLNLAAALLQDPALGIHFGSSFTPQRFGILGYLFHHCENLGDVYRRMQHYQRLHLHLRNSRVTRNGDLYTLGWHLGMAKPSYHEETFTLACALQFARKLTQQTIELNAVGLMNSAPIDTLVLDQFFGCPVHYDQSMTYLSSDRALLAVPNIHSDRALRCVLEEQAGALLSALPCQKDLLLELRATLVDLFQEGEPTLERAASMLNLSSRTLHRRLAARGFRFREILEKTRWEQAEVYLRDTRLSLAEVALLLGYAEQSPFTHAFKRWSGLTPIHWRKQYA